MGHRAPIAALCVIKGGQRANDLTATSDDILVSASEDGYVTKKVPIWHTIKPSISLVRLHSGMLQMEGVLVSMQRASWVFRLIWSYSVRWDFFLYITHNWMLTLWIRPKIDISFVVANPMKSTSWMRQLWRHVIHAAGSHIVSLTLGDDCRSFVFGEVIPIGSHVLIFMIQVCHSCLYPSKQTWPILNFLCSC